MTGASRICFVGDSLTLGVADPEGGGWVGRLLARANARGAGITGYNLGIRRDTSLDIAARWRSEVVARLPPALPGAIVFAFGTNDCLEENGARRVAPDETLAVARRVLVEARGIAPVLMIGPPPVADPSENSGIAALGEALAALCADISIPCFDSFGSLVAEEGWMAEIRSGDFYHPGAGGYAMLADKIARWTAWDQLVSPAREAA